MPLALAMNSFLALLGPLASLAWEYVQTDVERGENKKARRVATLNLGNDYRLSSHWLPRYALLGQSHWHKTKYSFSLYPRKMKGDLYSLGCQPAF